MSIIYSYPEETSLQGSDMLIGTSTALVGGKQKNITKNFTLDQLTSFIQGGEGVINPAATDFQIAVFNQSGSKITGSIMSQDVYPNGTGITISGNLSATGNLTASGTVTLGGGSNLIDLRSTTKFSGPIQDSNGLSGSVNQILLSNISGELVWGNYTAGLTYQGLWNAATNSPGLSSSVGVNSTFYIVGTAGNTVLNGNTDWQVGDWAIFVGTTGAGGVWQKIDNTSSITGNGTLNRMVMWSSNFTVTDGPLLDNSGTNVLSILDRSILPSVSNTRDLGSAALKWNMLYSNDIETTNINVLNHIDLAGLPGTPGQVFTSGGVGAPATWTTPTVGTITGTGQDTKIPVWTNSTAIGTSILTQLNAAGFFTNTYLSVDSGGISTPALKVDGFLLDSTGSKGTAGQILSSTGTATLWKTGEDSSVTYSLAAGAQDGASVPINLTDSLAVTTPVKITGGTNVNVVRTSATEITLSSTDTNTTYEFGSSTDGLDVLLNLVGTPTDDSSVKLIGSGVTITQANDEVTFTVPAGDTYDLGSGASVIANSVELQLTSGSGTDDSAVTLTGGTGITVQQTGDVVTLTGTAQGITGSGTIGKLPKFDTTTSLTDSIISETVGGIAIAGELDMSNNKIVNVTNPTAAQDAATKSYVDTVVTGQLVFQGGYDAVNNSPDLTTSPNSILKGWTYAVTNGPSTSFWSPPLNVGDLVIANIDNPTSVADWTEVQSNVGFAGSGATDGATVKGIAGFNSADFDVSNDGWVEAKDFTGTTPGYVPDATSAPTGAFLKEDGTWAVAGVGSVTNFSAVSTAYPGIITTVTNPTSTPELTLSLGPNAGAGKYLDGGTGDWVTLPAPGTGTVTSVGLTMPPAFSVGNSPITTAGNLSVTTTGGSPGQFLDYTGNWSSPGGGVSSVSFSNVINPSTGDALTITPTTGSVVVSANVFGGNGMHGIVSSGSPSNDALFLKGDGTWGAPTGASATITTASHSGDGSTLTFALGATPNGGSVNFVDAYIDGVYQETSTYTVSGTNIVFNAGNAPAVGTNLQTKTTSDYSVGAAVQTVSLGQSNETGNVNLRIAPVEVLSATTPTAAANHLYIFTATSGTPSTLTLPSNPVSGDSIKISNIGGLANVITPSGTDKIMGVAGSITMSSTAAFEMIWSGITAQGWIIIGNV